MGLFEALDLHLCLIDVKLNAFPQGIGTRLPERLLHAAQRLFLGAVGILQFLGQQFANFRFHRVLPSVSGSGRLALTEFGTCHGNLWQDRKP